MYCPKCKGKSFVKDSRVVDGNMIRQRVCKSCNYHFYTSEIVIGYLDGHDKLCKFYRDKSGRNKIGIKT